MFPSFLFAVDLGQALISYASDVGFACYVPLALQMKKAKRQIFRREYFPEEITQGKYFHLNSQSLNLTAWLIHVFLPKGYSAK